MKFLNKIAMSVAVLTAMTQANLLNRDGTFGVYRTHSAKTLGNSRMSVGILTNVTNDARVFQSVQQRPINEASMYSLEVTDFIGFTGYPFLGIGLGRFVDLSAVLPVDYDFVKGAGGLDQNGDGVGDKVIIGGQKNGIGDLKVQGKLRFPLPQEENIVDVAVLAGYRLGTSNKDRTGFWMREIEYVDPVSRKITGFGNVTQTFNAGLLVTLDFLRLEEAVPLEWNFNLAYRAPMTVYSSVFAMGSSLLFTPVEFLSLYAEVYHERPEVNVAFSDEVFITNFTMGGAIQTGVGIDFNVGINFGVARSGVIHGSPDVPNYVTEIQTNPSPPMGAIFGLTWNGFLLAQDDDKDGIVNKEDQCPRNPEDFDGFEDDNGCPDLDNDGDGINDVLDECPNKREDFDGFQDEDGCPDLDNDGDKVPDISDKCPLEAEDRDGFEDGDGCPEIDNDKDGIADDQDKCPLQKEDIDTFEDKDGCPDPDNDKDGILDDKDKCPLQPETVNTYKDDDGCPDKKPKEKPKEKPIAKTVTLKGVNFKTGTADLTFEAKEILQPVVRQLKAYPKVEIEIRGHTDSRGRNSANQRLSERRAQAVVDYLASQGIAMNRMKAIGMGEDQPIASNRTAAGRAKNRRIEMYRTK